MQLGKLDVSQPAQEDNCKTPDSRPYVDQWVTPQKQNAQPEERTLEFPLTISEWDRNKREIVRVALDQYNGQHTISIRVWYRDGEEIKPGRAGLTLAIKHLAPLATALSLALNAAYAEGLLDEGDQ